MNRNWAIYHQVTKTQVAVAAVEAFDPAQLESLTASAQALHKSQSHLRMTVTSQVDIMKQLIVEVSKPSCHFFFSCIYGLNY